jgi:ubiquitin-conjugating enzyme (huntingtin interacting protein 2)
VLTIKSTLLSLQSLFESPEPKDPQDAEVAKMMINDPDAFNAKAHEWAVMHAGAPKNVKYQVGKPKPRSSAASQQAVDDSRYAPSNPDAGLFQENDTSLSKVRWADSITDTMVTTRT